MHSSYTLNQGNKVKAIVISICTFSRLFIAGFVQHNADIFEGILRMTTPFGGNLRTRNR